MSVNNADIFKFISYDACPMCGSSVLKNIGIRKDRSQGLFPSRYFGKTTTIAKCKRCGLIFANPAPIPISDNKTEKYNFFVLGSAESYFQPSYFTLPDDSYFAYEMTFIKKYFHTDTLKTIAFLDAGAGIGKAIVQLQREGCRVTGIEPTKAFYKRGMEMFHLSPPVYVNQSLEGSEFEDNSFDVINFSASLEMMPHAMAAIEKSLRWVKKGGLIHIEGPSNNWLINDIFNLWYRLTLTEYTANLFPFHRPFHYFQWSKKTFELHGSSNGYKVVEWYQAVCDIPYIPKIFHPALILLMKMFQKGQYIHAWLKKQ